MSRILFVGAAAFAMMTGVALAQNLTNETTKQSTTTTTVPAPGAGVKAGVLTCDVASGWGFVFGSSRDIRCSYSSGPGRSEHYTGRISKYGVDIGYLQGGVMVWGVIAPTASLTAGALAGNYGGVTGGASVGVGVDANALIGGSNKSISLQPVSIEGDTGLNVAAGIASINLAYAPANYEGSSSR